MAGVEIRNLVKAFGKKAVLDGLSLRLSPGRAHAILGPNGCGKSTLLKCLLGLCVPDAGWIRIQGENAVGRDEARRHVGYMPQIPSFPENLAVREILDLVTSVRKQAPDGGYLKVLGVEGFLGQKWKTLSGGMKQKVNAALALCYRAPVLILDEPTASLDPSSRLLLKDLVLERRNQGATVLLTTHLLADVQEMADELVFLRGGRALCLSRAALAERVGAEGFERAVAALIEGGAAPDGVEAMAGEGRSAHA